ncbi:MAG: hypothetical protein AABX65_01295 [Nanoarchaeota archaeon]
MDKKELLVTILIGLLVLTAALQTAQLLGLSSGGVVVSSSGSSGAKASSSSASSSLPTNLQNLPSMVGGC